MERAAEKSRGEESVNPEENAEYFVGKWGRKNEKVQSYDHR